MNSNGVLRELQFTKYSRTSGMMEMEGGDGGGDEGGDGGDERDCGDGDIEKEMKTKGTGLSKSRL